MCSCLYFNFISAPAEPRAAPRAAPSRSDQRRARGRGVHCGTGRGGRTQSGVPRGTRPGRSPSPSAPRRPPPPPRGRRQGALRLQGERRAAGRAPLSARPGAPAAARPRTQRPRSREAAVGKVATVSLLAKNRYFLVQFGSHVCTGLTVCTKPTNQTNKQKIKTKNRDTERTLTGLPPTARPGTRGEHRSGAVFLSFPF